MTVIQNVFTRKDINANGEEIKLWNKVGILKETKNGGKFLQMFQQPNTDFYVFPNEKEEDLPEIN